MTGTDCSRNPSLPPTAAQVQTGSSPMLLLHKHIFMCCSCEKLEFFWHLKVTAIWRTGLEPAWGCVPPKQRQGGPPPAQEAQELSGLGTKNTNSAPLAGSKHSGQAMPQGWFSECQRREGPSCTGRSVASPPALLEQAPAPYTCSVASKNPPQEMESQLERDPEGGVSPQAPAGTCLCWVKHLSCCSWQSWAGPGQGSVCRQLGWLSTHAFGG